jgi:hypothetical protein
MKIFLEVVSLLVIGWVAGAETGSWCCVQPIVERLPYEQQVAMERAMLRTFGRIMPVLMPLSGIVAIALVLFSRSDGSAVLGLRIIAAICIAIAIVTTLAVNVPINNLTSKWQLANDPEEWSQLRMRWHFFQGVRGGLFLAAFGLLVLAIAISQRS